MYKYIALCICLWTAGNAAAQRVHFEVKSNTKQVVQGNYFTLTYTLYNAKPKQFLPPNLEKNFRIVSGPNRNAMMQVINGRVSEEVSFSYSLLPRKAGTVTIPPARIVTQTGEQLKSEALKIVTVASARDLPGGNEKNIELEEGVFLRLVPSTTTPHVGEQVTIDAKIYTKLNLDKIRLLEIPEFAGLRTEPIESYPDEVELDTLDGKQYTTKVLYRMALFPEQPGKIEVGSALARVGVLTEAQRNRSYHAYWGRQSTSQMLTKMLESEPFTLNVSYVPEGPRSFTGAIGTFSVTMHVDKQQLTTDDAFTLTMDIRGAGDIKRVLPPDLALSKDSFEVYAPQTAVSDFEFEGKVGGIKQITYEIVPKLPMTATFRPEFTYFEDVERKFITVDTAFALNITQGRLPLKPKQMAKDSTVSLLEPTALATSYRTIDKTPWFFNRPLFWVSAVLPFLLLGGLWYWEKHQARQAHIPPAKKATKQAKNELKAAKQALESKDASAFYTALSRGIYTYLQTKFSWNQTDLTASNIRETLNKVAFAQTDELLELLELCNQARYGGASSMDGLDTLYQKATRLIQALEKVKIS